MKVEFGDFQTPPGLAREIAAFLRDNGEKPDAVVEPTCGQGSLLLASMDIFPQSQRFYGYDVNPQHVVELDHTVRQRKTGVCRIERRDFFQSDWHTIFGQLNGYILVIGNPPWVTNSVLSVLNGNNLPRKTNFQGHAGFAAKTGKANFDISEWMLIRLIGALENKSACLAMLCKTAAARKTLRYVWLDELRIGRCSLHAIDAKKHFGVSVGACLLVIHTGEAAKTPVAPVYADLSFQNKTATWGLMAGELVADIDEYSQLRDIDNNSVGGWRSGVKHDAASVMEFRQRGDHYVNGRSEPCDLESTFLYPLLKSSDIANGRSTPTKLVLLTQRNPSDDTRTIANVAAKTWQYLNQHSDALDNRRSIIYQKRARFSVFGIGDYTFFPWKVAVSALYKNCRFEVVGQYEGKPIVMDDTCCFLPCRREGDAQFVHELLNSNICQRFLRSLVFFDPKRPITIDILNRIDLKRIAERLNRQEEAQEHLYPKPADNDKQLRLDFGNENMEKIPTYKPETHQVPEHR